MSLGVSSGSARCSLLGVPDDQKSRGFRPFTGLPRGFAISEETVRRKIANGSSLPASSTATRKEANGARQVPCAVRVSEQVFDYEMPSGTARI